MASGEDDYDKVTSTKRLMVDALARFNGARANSRPTPGVMCQQGQDWSRGIACIPQEFVRLIGHRDPDARPTSAATRMSVSRKKPMLGDTPIG